MAKETVKKANKNKEKETKSKIKTKSKKTNSKSKVTSSKSDVAKETKKTTSNAKKETTSKAKVASKKQSSTKPNKASVKKVSNSKIAKKTSSRKNIVDKEMKSTAKPMLAEYYDLPYRYNETTVKILAQTPTTLFVYWDISDEDRKILMEKHSDNVFYNTRPVLVVHNTTKNYSFEIEINDFANSWYIRTQEPNCNYVIELGRRKIDSPEEYIYIHSSNNIISPNDHILFDQMNLGKILFRNVKNNQISSKDFGSLRFINDMDKLYGNVYDVYSRLYKDETLNELTMPTSGEFINR